MLKSTLLSVLAHHGEAADPDLLKWIKGVLDHLLGVGSWVVVVMIGLLILAIPVAIAVFYLLQQRRASSGAQQTAGRFPPG